MKANWGSIRTYKHLLSILVLSSIYVFLSILTYHQLGTKIVNDSPRYLEYAEQLKSGFYFDRHNFWYLGYVFFIFLIKVFTQEVGAIILAQHLLSLIALLTLYKASYALFQDRMKATITALLFIFFVEINSWNAYILPESFYLSMTCFSLCFLILIFHKTKNWSTLLMGFVIVSVTALSKPTGIALLMALAFSSSMLINLKWRWPLLGIAMVVSLLLANTMLDTFRVIELNYVKGEVVYAVGTLPNDGLYDPLILDVPKDMVTSASDQGPVMQIVTFIVQNPWYWTKLFCLKVFFFLTHVRPYWSDWHNLFSVVFLLPMYYHAIRTLRSGIPKTISHFAVSYLLIHIIIIGITSVDWDGRFLVPLLPVIFLCATPAIKNTLIHLRLMAKAH
ncbi:MAG: glycosyltransferase family 39 protein [Cyclobacteriaceae bacterium]|nr:glycosyltransferase family 39 protein [Cyclobacteriaceae bacterium HetDA_MAG_MS6]